MIHVCRIINGIDDMTCEKFLNLLIMMVLEILIEIIYSICLNTK